MTTQQTKTVFFKRHDQDDFIDEVRIVVRERYKTSGLSGDEWRFHRVIQLFRKGVLLHEEPFNGTMQTVSGFVPLVIAQWGDNGVTEQRAEHLCFQPGCAEPATSEFELIEEFGPQGQRLHPDENGSYFSMRRRFCQKHLRRGDCGREDSDRNYRVLSGYGAEQADMSGANVVESARVDVQIDSIEQVGDAVAKAMRERTP